MHCEIPLDCELGDWKEVCRHKGALTISILMYQTYIKTKDQLIGTGPELYAECWIKSFVKSTEDDTGDLVMKYFIRIIMAAQKDG